MSSSNPAAGKTTGDTATTQNTAAATLVQQSYDKIADIYLDWQLGEGKSPREDYLATLVSHLSNPSTAKVLELGCGAGVPGTQLLSKSCGHVTGVDISIAQIKLAKKHVKAENVKLIQSDMLALEFGDGALDAVVGLYSIFHLKRDEQKLMMERIYKWLSAGGMFVANFAVTGQEVTNKWLGGEEMFWAGWDKEEWLGIVKEIGFEILKGDVVRQVEHGNDVDTLWIVAKKGGGKQ